MQKAIVPNTWKNNEKDSDKEYSETIAQIFPIERARAKRAEKRARDKDKDRRRYAVQN